MAFLAVDKSGEEYIYEVAPIRSLCSWLIPEAECGYNGYSRLPHGSIKRLIGRELKWEDEPVKLKEE